jgi:hypothetical protein
VLAQFRSSLTYSNVMATVAVFVALGGTSYAVATGSIDSRELKNNSVRSKDVRNNDVRSKDVRNGSLLAADFKAGQLPAGKTGPAGPQGVKGAPGATNVIIRKGNPYNVTADGSTSDAVPCDTGEVATGGGVSLESPPDSGFRDVVVTDTEPDDSSPADGIPEGWHTAVGNNDANNNNTGDFTARTVVVCSSP